jgi:hypothetical protein
MKQWYWDALSSIFTCLSDLFGELSNRCSICPDCGRNRYTGAPCKGDYSECATEEE